MSLTEEEALPKILEHWIEHNEHHIEEFRKWAEKAKGFGKDAIHDDIMEAAEHMDTANKTLTRALGRVQEGGISA